MTIIRGAGAGDAVVTILRAAAQDSRLSLRARGALVLCMSRPPDWRTDAEQISREAREGERAVLTCLKELAHFGYLRRERVRLPNGRIVTEWVITDDPRSLADPRFSRAGSPRAGSPRAAAPRARAPRADEPQAVAPRAGSPRAAAPRARAPRADEPQAEDLRPLLERETEGETPPPAPAVVDVRDARARQLVVVVREALEGRAPMPGGGVALGACRRLVDEGWEEAQVAAVVEDHDWSGARAGAVVAFLRGLTDEDKPSPQARGGARKRRDWCGACDQASRLLMDDQGRPRKGQLCPDCGGPA